MVNRDGHSERPTSVEEAVFAQELQSINTSSFTQAFPWNSHYTCCWHYCKHLVNIPPSSHPARLRHRPDRVSIVRP